MNRADRIDRIAQIPLFTALPPSELECLADILRLREFTSGTLLMREGVCDDLIYILLDGETEVIKALDTPDEHLIAIREPGSLFGEMSLFTKQGSHTASVRARTLAHAYEMTRQDFDALLRRCPTLVYEMMRRISQHLEQTQNLTILDLREKNRQLTQAYQELKAAQAQLIIKEQLERELEIARQIQKSILPESLPCLEGFEIAALTVPARAVGGDYYDFIPIDGNRLGLVVGDACDKGIPAALLINLTNSLVHVEAPRNDSPDATLHQVNRHLVEMSRSGMFVTLLYGILDVTGRFDYCRAGHPHPVVIDENMASIKTEPCCGMPLGIQEEIELEARSLTIPLGGLAIIYSDGLIEAQDAGGYAFGTERLPAELRSIGHLPAGEICQGLWSRVQEFSCGKPQSDDFTVVVIKRAR